jgi:plastocyanin
MRRHIAKLLGLLAACSILVLWLAAAPMAAGGGGCHGDADRLESTTQATNEIKVMPCAFGPTVAQVPVGATVTFFNGPENTHLITGANRAWGSGDMEVQPGKKVTYTFAKAGIYPYACAIHSGMSGVIVVGDVASTSTEGTTAATTTGGSAAPPASTASTLGSPIGSVGLIAGGALAGAIAGASIIWLVMRRRTASSRDEVHGVA